MATLAAPLIDSGPSRKASASRTLNAAGAFWFVTAATGQLLFAVYIAIFYAGTGLRGEFSRWNEVLSQGIRTGDASGNTALAIHLALALAITLSGPLQLVPAVRRHFPRFHRWNGRIYMVAAYAISLAGLLLLWSRGSLPGWSLPGTIAISINALLIMAFAALAWRTAMRRDFAAHRRWALRLFLAVSGVWFLRAEVMLWSLANGGPVGLGENLGGPAGVALTFAQYAIPLAFLELYFAAQRSRAAAPRWLMAGGLIAATSALAIGIALAAQLMWLPHII